jgi:hypothetical protein
MEETDPVAGEGGKGPPPAPDREEVGNVLRLPVESASEDTPQEKPPEPNPQGHHFTVVSSLGGAAPEIMATEASPSESPAPESVAAAPRVDPEEPGPAESENVSPDLKDLLDVAAVQAAVDAIVDAAVRGSDDELDY